MHDQALHVFVNPTAGRGRAAKRIGHIRAILESAGLEVVLHESLEPLDLERQVLDLARSGGRRIVVAGGDGSVHEAVNGILASGEDVQLGVVPAGTGNDFAKAAGITLAWQDAATLLADNLRGNVPPRRIDAGRVNDRYFANGAGIGFDAKVTALARSYRWPIGDAVYLIAIFRAFAGGIATPPLRIESGDGELLWDGPLTLANVSNGAWVGGMFHIAPMAKNDDGRLELLVAAPVTRRRIVRLLPKLMQGKHIGEPEILHRAVTDLVITSEEPLPSHLDGEVQAPARQFRIELLPGALRLL